MLTESKAQLKPGNKAPDFELLGIDGKIYSLQSFKDKEGLLIIFMCNHCPYVKARMGELSDLYNQFGKKIGFIGINSSDPDYPGEGIGNMNKFAEEYGIKFPYVTDEIHEVAREYGATCTPDPFLLDKDMKLVFHGRISDALEPDDNVQELTMKENIKKLLAGKKIEPWFNPSIGCSIKFREELDEESL